MRARAPVYRHAVTDLPRVALTFDDGPNPPYTDRILELLRHYRVPATFFFLGRNIEMHPLTARRAIQDGHEIGNHTYWHRHPALLSPAGLLGEIDATDRQIRDLGYRGPIPFRPPFGEWFPVPWLALSVRHRPIYLYDAAPSPPDYLRGDPELIAAHALQRVTPGSVILLHDGEGIRAESVIAAEQVIRRLLARGYRFERISDLFGAAPAATHPSPAAPSSTSALR
jgi:peptidoglycan/xylan/chitin deacetylase (PgdA/CDA1 family)